MSDLDEIVTAILKDGDRVLLCHRSHERRWYPNVWDLPGGHVEPGETAPQALVRELREELAVTIDEPGSAPRTVIITDGFRMQVWLIEVWAGTVTNAAPDEHDEFAWVDRSELGTLELAHSDYRSLLADALS